MSFAEQLRPRADRDASWAALILVAVGAVVTAVFAVLAPPPGLLALVVAYAVPGVLVCLCVLVTTLPSRWRPYAAGLPPPVLGIVAIVSLDLATHDSSAAAQVFFCYPVVYATWQLRRNAAMFVVLLSLAGDATVVVRLERSFQGVIDIVYVSATLVTVAFLLIRAGREHDALVTQLRRQAAMDPLTGLVTRRVLDSALVQALERKDARTAVSGAARSETGAALVLVDVDGFKQINDTYGHPVGDDILTHIANIVAAKTRVGDVLSRLGGDEIALLMPECSSTAAVRRGQELVTAVRSHPWHLPDATVVDLSISVGVAHAPTDARSVRELYSAADAGLYVAKRGGRDRVGVPYPAATATQA